MFDPYKFTRPILMCFSPEFAHGLSLFALRCGVARFYRHRPDPILATSIAGLDLPSPVGLAAGYDKNAEAPDTLLNLGFGFVEVGTLTPLAQPGNPKPRIFRLQEDEAIINRLGFNNAGQPAAEARLRHRRHQHPGIVGINLGANKTSHDRMNDYVQGVTRMGALANYITINISSPNTPGLRALQSKDALTALLSAVMTARDALANRPPLFLKVAPDLDPLDIADIADACLDAKVDGLIVSNTTITRPDTLASLHATEQGGLSGAPLFNLSTEVLGEFYARLGDRVPIIGVGGIRSAEDAYAKICAGASAVQLYSALVYHGPGLVRDINRGLAELLRRDGHESVAAAVGSTAVTS